MLQVAAFIFNPFQENTYVLFNEHKECWIIDPGMYGADEERVLFSFIEQHGLQPKQILNTHAHIDHVLGIDAVKAKYNIPFGMHTLEQPVLANVRGSATMFGFHMPTLPVADFFISEQERLRLGEDELEVRLAPGHSPGSIIFYSAESGWLIGGDVLFNGSVGRSDLPGGNHETLMKSIKEQLYTLPDNTVVYSGHGPETSIGQEKKTNPFVRG
ncbi:MBL fold metallo-hydrolase [Taibaiella helva]|uniref:MBL fold metallo-hydrolase n=1 Tax=Taibaiella helva TaxID=2301235 RepID=UPI000E589BF7|nr:MBL fold metallo-hydrolase [Taibaiella helva]